MEKDIFDEVTIENVIKKNDGLQEAVIDRAIDYYTAGLMPYESYERHVECISSALRSWCMYRVHEDVDSYVGMMAKAFIQFIRARYGYAELKTEEDEEDFFSKIHEGEYEAFSDCLRADVSREFLRLNKNLVGMREFFELEKECKSKK